MPSEGRPGDIVRIIFIVLRPWWRSEKGVKTFLIRFGFSNDWAKVVDPKFHSVLIPWQLLPFERLASFFNTL
jgi:hypothetical protein